MKGGLVLPIRSRTRCPPRRRAIPIQVLGSLLGMVTVGCPGVQPEDDVSRPPSSRVVRVNAVADPPAAGLNSTIVLTASVDGGTPPYVYRWDVNDAPVTPELNGPFDAVLTPPPLTTVGRYVFRVTVTDREGHRATDLVAVQIGVPVVLSVDPPSEPSFEGDEVTLSAVVEGGVEPFEFSWVLTEGPPAGDYSTVTGGVLNTGPLTVAGRYVFRVTVTDAAGSSATDIVAIEVDDAVSVEDPVLALLGEPIQLSAEVLTDADGVSLRWTAPPGTATVENETTATPMVIVHSLETVLMELTLSLPGAEGMVEVTREVAVVGVADRSPQVEMVTNFGTFMLELDGERAPRHAANFLRYADEGFYEGLLFHRNACGDFSGSGECEPFALQGGGYRRLDGQPVLSEPTHDPIDSETGNGLSNGALYSVSLALTNGDPDSGATQFFINLKDNSFLDAQEFTVFGSVVTGREVVDSIVGMQRTENPVIPDEVSLPVEDVIIMVVRRVAGPGPS